MAQAKTFKWLNMMIGAKCSKRNAILLAAGLFAFCSGVAVHKYKPYNSIMEFAKAAFTGKRPFDPSEVTRQYARDIVTLALDRFVDTSLLPIKIEGARLGERFPVPKSGGAITVVGDKVLVLDRMGNIYLNSSARRTEKMAFPPLPTNADDLVRAGFQLNTHTLRAYSIIYQGKPERLVVSHEAFDRALGKTRMTISAIAFGRDTLKPSGGWTTIFSGDPEPEVSSDAGGGRLVATGDDTLLLTVGVYAVNGSGAAQESGTTFGKILKITISSGKAEVVSIGHRNPQGLLVTSSGEILSTEHGPAGGDELNVIRQGANFGWPDVTLGTDYTSYNWGSERPQGRHSGFQLPMFAWVPSIAVSNLIEVKGFDDRWNGDLLVSSLKAQSLFRLRLEGPRVLYSEPIWIGQRIRDIAQLGDGTIVLWTDDAQLLFLSVNKDQLKMNVRLSSSVRGGETLIYSCMYCHHFGPTSAADMAPSLSGLFQRKIASDNYRYSAGLRDKEGTWNEKALSAFLSNPGQFANGTSMPSTNLSPDEVGKVIEVLKELTNKAN